MWLEEIKNKINNSPSLSFGDIFNANIELFKKVWVQGLVILLLNLVLAIPLMIIVYIPLFIFGMAGAFMSGINEATLVGFGIVTTIGVLLGYLFLITGFMTIQIGLKAAFYRICKMKDTQEIGSDDYFFFFKKPYLAKTFKIAMFNMGIVILCLLLCGAPMIYAFVPISFIPMIYAMHPNLKAIDVIKLSFDMGNAKWGITFLLIFVSGMLASVVGFLMCFIGVYVTISFVYLVNYSVYKDTLGFENNTKISENIS